ncbi:hypothetical protein JRQ81_006696 [Phrynocephalus forsythii]|uniref:Uncharacterized protein n=1 Tax=Phrynocephalus forsythii TaxID=171643 RepID=A0A9Q0XFH4_9SAUR|nr:hypothetical protein JRQ81_006696 [Phrynocephalus forsythii]
MMGWMMAILLCLLIALPPQRGSAAPKTKEEKEQECGKVDAQKERERVKSLVEELYRFSRQSSPLKALVEEDMEHD